MGLFRQKDELFEIMSRQQGSVPGKSSTGSGSRVPSTSSVGLTRTKAPRSAFSPISWAYGRSEGLGDLIEIDGEPLVIVEDGLTEALETAEETPRTFSVRADTVVVGGLLSLGLVCTAFFLGRTTGDPTETPTPALAVSVSTADPGGNRDEGAEQAAQPEVTQTQAASSRNASTTVQAGFRPGATATPKPASVKRDAKPGQYTLVVCTTNAKAGQDVAKWLNADSRSPIFGRSGLEAYATSRGSVRIKGFATRDSTVLSRVRATYDPLGGSSKFTSAYYLKSR